MLLSDGSLKTPTFTTDGWFTSMPPMSSNGWPTAYAGIYSQQLWVYVVVSKLAKAEARLPLIVYEKGENEGDDRIRKPQHPMAKLLAAPNPGLSSFDLWLWTRSMRSIYGQAFWYKQRSGGEVVGLYPLNPPSMRYDDEKSVWNFDNGSLKLDAIKDADIVHFKDFNPSSSTYGMSALEPLRSTLENEWNARASTSSFWQKGARPSVLLKHPTQLSDKAEKSLKASWERVASGSGNAGSTVVLEEGINVERWEMSAEEAQYIETRKLNREEVCAAYDIPPPVVHILDHATFSNITEQMRSMYRDTMAPLLKQDEATIEIDLRRAEWPNDDVYAEFLMDEVLRGDFEARSDAYSKADFMTIAEKRSRENLPFIPGTDRVFMNAANQPMPAPQSGDIAPPPPFATVGLPALIAAGVLTEQDARLLLSIPGRAPGIPAEVTRSLMGRLSWQKSLDQIDVKALVADLNGATVSVLQALDEVTAEGGDVADLRERIRSLVKE